MKLTVRVKPNARNEGVEESAEGLIVRVNAPPVEGKANKRVIELLARRFHVPKSAVVIIGGGKGKMKIVEILS